MHPEVDKFVKRFEKQSKKNSYRHNLNKFEILFLECVWGPLTDFVFDDLEPQHPFKDFRGGNRFADYIYTRRGIKLLIEIDGFTTHARDISPGDFDDHLMRQNDLVLQGWMILRFTASQVENQPMQCQRQIMQALGHWWTLINADPVDQSVDIWAHRSKMIAKLAFQSDGIVKSAEIAAQFSIPLRTARSWVNRLVADEILVPIRPNQKITGYRLNGY